MNQLVELEVPFAYYDPTAIGIIEETAWMNYLEMSGCELPRGFEVPTEEQEQRTFMDEEDVIAYIMWAFYDSLTDDLEEQIERFNKSHPDILDGDFIADHLRYIFARDRIAVMTRMPQREVW